MVLGVRRLARICARGGELAFFVRFCARMLDFMLDQSRGKDLVIVAKNKT